MLRSRWTPSPCSRLSRPRTTTGPPSHRSLLNRSTGSVPSYAPAASPRLRRRLSPWPLDRRHQSVEEFSEPWVRCALQPSPYPSDLSWWTVLRGVLPLVSHVHLSVLLAGPEPSDGAGPSRLCRGCLPPSPSSQGSGCLQLHQPAATGWRRRSCTSSRFKSASWRSMSDVHTWSIPSGANSRFTRSGG
jgi:hypothetical protein